MNLGASDEIWRLRILDAFVRWPERADKKQIALSRRKEDVTPTALFDRVFNSLRDVAKEDVSAAITWFLADLALPAPHGRAGDISIPLHIWMGKITDLLNLGPQREQGGAVIASARWRHWAFAACNYDIDAILTFALAKRGLKAREYDGQSWNVVCPLWSLDVEEIMSHGVADMHIHLRGCRPANLIWLRTILADLEPEEMRELWRQLEVKKEVSNLIKRYLRDGYESAQQKIVTRILSWLPHNAIHELTPSELITAERKALLEAWPAAIVDYERGEREALIDLDCYFNAKCGFISMLAQGTDEGAPGLQRFRDFFAAGGAKFPAARGAARTGREISDAIALAAPAVQRMELRISPLEENAGYEQLFAAHERIAKPPREVRFALHFQRSISPARIEMHGPYAEWRKFFRDLSADSARFHAFRRSASDEGSKDAAARLALIPRIDVAGQERDNPPDNFAFIARLLRGDERAAEMLAEADDDIYNSWRAVLARSDTSRLPHLRASCHAGEDFFHPLDGLAAIDSALRGFAMSDGDSLGHALALGAIDENGACVTPQRAFAPIGRQFSVLLWLHRVVSDANDVEAARELPAIERGLDKLGHDLRVARPRAGWDRLHDFLEYALGPVLPPRRNDDDPARRLQRARWSEEGVKLYGRIAPVHLVFDKLPLSSLCAKRVTAHEVAARHVVIEINPSSNIRVSGLATLASPMAVQQREILRRWPVTNMIREFRGSLRFAVSTDDPGVFATTLQSEYALLYECMLEDGHARSDVVSFLESCRATSMSTLR